MAPAGRSHGIQPRFALPPAAATIFFFFKDATVLDARSRKVALQLSGRVHCELSEQHGDPRSVQLYG